MPSGGNPWQITYASLLLSGLPFGRRMFGYRGLWSDCSRYFVIPEWRHNEHSRGPDMHLLAIEVGAGKECVIARAINGFIEPTLVQDGFIRFNMVVPGMQRIISNRRISDLTTWGPVSESMPDADEALDQ